MPPSGIIEKFDVIKHVGFRLVSRAICLVRRPFGLEHSGHLGIDVLRKQGMLPALISFNQFPQIKGPENLLDVSKTKSLTDTRAGITSENVPGRRHTSSLPPEDPNQSHGGYTGVSRNGLSGSC